MTESNRKNGWRRLLLIAAEGVVILYFALDGIFTPIFRPLARWTAKLRLILKLQDLIARLPPYGVLAALAVPFVTAEPAKVYAVLLIASGHFLLGAGLLALAYAVSLVVVDRIYNAGREKLRTIAWFALALDWIIEFRDYLIAWARSTPAWALAMQVSRRARAMVAQIRLGLRLG